MSFMGRTIGPKKITKTKPEDTQMAQIRRWFRVDANGVPGKTRYEGVFIKTPTGLGILVSDLSHGWRARWIEDPRKIHFEEPHGEEFELPPQIMAQILEYVKVDRAFQDGAGKYFESKIAVAKRKP